MTGSLYICGGDFRPGPRDNCPRALHNWPLPAGYVDAAEVAERRIRNGWKNRLCSACGLFGWVEGRKRAEGDTRVEYDPRDQTRKPMQTND